MPSTFEKLDLSRVPSPCFVVDEAVLERNLALLARVQAEAGARVLLALKAFSMFAVGPQVMRHLRGVAASGLWEARLGREEYGGEVHAFSPAYSQEDLADILALSDHVVFNSAGQWRRFRDQARAARAGRPELRLGLRINPEHSEGTTEIYDPCAPCSRLGATRASLEGADLDGLSGLHFHTLCEQGLPPLKRTVAAVEQKFGHLFEAMDWINFGGGHLITQPGYDVDGLIAFVAGFG
ncbi:MAG: carboxynorspermidine decarboxylase, partial [Hyphomicrobiales bacterium]